MPEPKPAQRDTTDGGTTNNRDRLSKPLLQGRLPVLPELLSMTQTMPLLTPLAETTGLPLSEPTDEGAVATADFGTLAEELVRVLKKL